MKKMKKMNKAHHHTRGHFSSSFGFILATAGSAIGLGNLWKFPYIAGQGGGGLFVLLYLFFVLVLGVPMILSEMAIGRRTQLSAVSAYRTLNPRWTFIGVIGVACAFIILSYYSVVGGWVTKYIFDYARGVDFGDTAAYFTEFISSPAEPVIWHLIFIAFCAAIVIFGVQKGIEKASKIMLPVLFVLIVAAAVRSVMLPGAAGGIRYLLVPDFSAVDTVPKFMQVAVLAMGQVFFSLSVGMGISIAYGSYLKKDSSLMRDAGIVGGLDTLVAVLSGLAIMPAVFAFGFEPTAGPGLIFQTLPAVFADMPLGRGFALLFFVLVFFAAATSAIALMEVVASFCIDTLHWSRRRATILPTVLMAAIGVVASLSMGPLSGWTVGGMNLFDALGFLTDKLLLPVSALCMTIFIGHVWGVDAAAEEIAIGAARGFRLKKAYGFLMRWVAPALIAVIFVMGLVQG